MKQEYLKRNHECMSEVGGNVSWLIAPASPMDDFPAFCRVRLLLDLVVALVRVLMARFRTASILESILIFLNAYIQTVNLELFVLFRKIWRESHRKICSCEEDHLIGVIFWMSFILRDLQCE